MYAQVRGNSIGECIGVALLTKAAEGFAQKDAGISHGLVQFCMRRAARSVAWSARQAQKARWDVIECKIEQGHAGFRVALFA